MTVAQPHGNPDSLTIDGAPMPIVLPRPGDRFIHHPFTLDAKRRILAHIDRGLHSGGADMMAMFGPSGSGKTEIIRHVMSLPQFAPTRTAQPIVYVETANAETPKSLAISILDAMGDYKPDRGTQAQIQRRAVGLLQQKQARLLIIDEAQLLSTDKYSAGDFFRQFTNQPIVPVLIVGLPSIAAMIQSNAQAGRRASPSIKLGAFDYKRKDERMMFLGVLKALYADLPPPFNSLPEDFEGAAKRYYFASGGLIARITQLLRVSLDIANEQSATALTFDILAEAYDLIAELFTMPPENPFRLNFLPAVLKKAADTIGMRTS